MNRSDLVAAIADRIGDKKKAKQAVDALVETVTDAVARGEKVAVSGLGTFERAYRASTDSTRAVAGVTVPKFEPAKGFRVLVDEALNLGEQAIAAAAAAVSDGKGAAQVRKVASKAQAQAEKKYGKKKSRPSTPPAPAEFVPQAPVGEAAKAAAKRTAKKAAAKASTGAAVTKIAGGRAARTDRAAGDAASARPVPPRPSPWPRPRR